MGWLESQAKAMDDPSKADFFLQYPNGVSASIRLGFLKRLKGAAAQVGDAPERRPAALPACPVRNPHPPLKLARDDRWLLRAGRF